jgi:hypothetical protein
MRKTIQLFDLAQLPADLWSECRNRPRIIPNQYSARRVDYYL